MPASALITKKGQKLVMKEPNSVVKLKVKTPNAIISLYNIKDYIYDLIEDTLMKIFHTFSNIDRLNSQK